MNMKKLKGERKMKIKKVIIEIKPTKEALKEFAEVFGKVKRRENVAKKRSVGFSDISSFRKFFSKKRIELLSTIKHKKPKSIYHLAKLTERKYKNEYDDVELLEELGLITRENHKVEVEFSKLSVEVVV